MSVIQVQNVEGVLKRCRGVDRVIVVSIVVGAIFAAVVSGERRHGSRRIAARHGGVEIRRPPDGG